MKLESGLRRAVLVLFTLLLLSSLMHLVVTDATPATPEVNEWTNMRPDKKPQSQSGHAMAYDAESDRIVLFGGWLFLDNTWAYDYNTNTWTDMNPDTRPSPRTKHEMAYDAESDRVILFGGLIPLKGGGFGPGGDYGVSGETWAYDLNTNTWVNMEPDTAPSPRRYHAVAYDAESDRIVLFGGGTARETWAYDYNTNIWTDMEPAGGPPNLAMHAMAYDRESDMVILFGGWSWRPPPNDKTWAYDYNTNTWTNMEPDSAPSPRRGHSMAYSAESDWVILFGGVSETTDFDDTWAYDHNSNTWTNMNPDARPSAGFGEQMAYDSQSDVVIQQTWAGNTLAFRHALEKPPPLEVPPEVGLDEEPPSEERPQEVGFSRLTPLVTVVAVAVVIAVAAVAAYLLWGRRGTETISRGKSQGRAT